MNQKQIDKIIIWLEKKVDNSKAESMVKFLKSNKTLDEKIAYIQKNIQQNIINGIIYEKENK